MAVIRSILVHHHATIYTDPVTGEMYSYSFIGRWVNELSRHFDKVGLLFHEVSTRSGRHDTVLNPENITLETLGPPGKGYDRFQKMARVKAACNKASGNYDALIIRGVTPRQYTVFNAVNVNFKAFLLVGSIRDSKPHFQLTISGFLAYLMYHIRNGELRKISKKANLIMANSPKVVTEIRNTFGVNSLFIPTNTLRKNEIRLLRHKEIGAQVSLYFCGRMVVDKGIFELLEAVSILNRRNIDCRLTFTGIMQEELMLKFKKLTYWDEIENKIRFTGFVIFGEDLHDLYDSHDIYVLPSYHEGFPHSIWEAAAVSTPVITTAVGGIPGILTDKEVWFIPKQQPIAIADKVIEIVANPHKVWDKTKALYKLVQKNTVEAGVKKLVIGLTEIENPK